MSTETCFYGLRVSNCFHDGGPYLIETSPLICKASHERVESHNLRDTFTSPGAIL